MLQWFSKFMGLLNSISCLHVPHLWGTVRTNPGVGECVFLTTFPFFLKDASWNIEFIEFENH